MSKPDPFAQFNKVLGKNFYKPDLQAMRIIMGTSMAHYLNIGDPAWVFLVGPPGTGKTTMSIMAACGLDQVIPLGDVTEKTFLSGFYGHEKPGLLEKLSKTRTKGRTSISEGNALILIKDFTTVLSMRREKRSVILSQLREIHDGEFKRDFGTGETKIWRGKVSIIAAVTPVLDRHYSIFTTLGERFMQVRWHRPDSPEAGEWAIRQQGHENEIRRELRKAVGHIFKDSSPAPPELSDSNTVRIANLAEIVAVSRTHVFRENSGNRDIEYVPEPEANTRIAKGLAAIVKGIAALNQRTEVAEQDLQDALRVGLDCIPEVRRKVLVAAAKGDAVDSVSAPRTTKRRAIEDLKELEVLGEDEKLSEGTQELLKVAKLSLSD